MFDNLLKSANDTALPERSLPFNDDASPRQACSKPSHANLHSKERPVMHVECSMWSIEPDRANSEHRSLRMQVRHVTAASVTLKCRACAKA